MNKTNRAVIFDLDGTLIDTLDDLTNSVNYALSCLNMPLRSRGEVKNMIGNGVSVLMQRALGCDDADLHRRALCLQREFYASHESENSRPYDGICKMLQSLKKTGYVICVYTNKDEKVAKTLCGNKLGNLCDYVCGTVDDGKTKPDAQRLLQLLNSLNNPGSVYCGDSDVDILTARNAHLPCVCVTWGYRDRQFLASRGARYFADTPDDVVRLVRELAE